MKDIEVFIKFLIEKNNYFGKKYNSEKGDFFCIIKEADFFRKKMALEEKDWLCAYYNFIYPKDFSSYISIGYNSIHSFFYFFKKSTGEIFEGYDDFEEKKVSETLEEFKNIMSLSFEIEFMQLSKDFETGDCKSRIDEFISSNSVYSLDFVHEVTSNLSLG